MKMSYIGEINQFREILKNFKNLEIDLLEEEEALCARKIDELFEEIESKLKLEELIDMKIEELERKIEDNKEVMEVITVHNIKVKNQQKKLERKNKKTAAKCLDGICIDAKESDKIRFRKILTKLNVLKSFTKVHIDKDSGKIIMTEGQNPVVFQGNQNPTMMWNKMKESSAHIDEWAQLFGLKK